MSSFVNLFVNYLLRLVPYRIRFVFHWFFLCQLNSVLNQMSYSWYTRENSFILLQQLPNPHLLFCSEIRIDYNIINCFFFLQVIYRKYPSSLTDIPSAISSSITHATDAAWLTFSFWPCFFISFCNICFTAEESFQHVNVISLHLTTVDLYFVVYISNNSDNFVWTSPS